MMIGVGLVKAQNGLEANRLDHGQQAVKGLVGVERQYRLGLPTNQHDDGPGIGRTGASAGTAAGVPSGQFQA